MRWHVDYFDAEDSKYEAERFDRYSVRGARAQAIADAPKWARAYFLWRIDGYGEHLIEDKKLGDA